MTMRLKTQRRLRPKVVVRHNVACQSSRTSSIRGIVLHDTEGANIKGIGDLAGLGNFFDRLATQASSHVANDAEGQSARYVPDAAKAWHCAAFNSVSLGIEQIGKAAQLRWPEDQLHETARWIAEWSIEHNIPIRKGRVLGGVWIRKGVLRHMDLGAAGGGHHDPGTDYPFDFVLKLARLYKEARNGR